MLTISLGVLSSVATELIVWLNQKLQGTVLQGKASFLLATVVSVVIACVKVFYVDGVPFAIGNYTTMAPIFAQVFAASQIFFVLVVKNLNLDVQS